MLTSSSHKTAASRRSFFGAAAASALSYSRILGANDRLRLALIGCGDRGRYDMRNFIKAGNVDVVALCDVWGDNIGRAKQAAGSQNVKSFTDHRKVVEANDLELVLICVPDHWHAPIAIDALNAGKDVFIEKPLTLRCEEGPMIVKAARSNNRICQVGMQQRSGAHYLAAKRDYIDSGKLGKITLCRTWWHGNSYHLRRAPAALARKPANLDWDRFIGPVKWRDWDPQQFWNWRAYLDFGGGQVTDLFTHWLDVVHMFMGEDLPVSAQAAGGIYHFKDGRTAPDTINVILEYPSEFTVTFEATLARGIGGAAQEFCGTQGRLWIDRSRYEFYPPGRNTQPVVVKAQSSLDMDHVRNFLECVRTRKLPNADVLVGHRSAQASHLGNIAYMEKRRIEFDPVREEILPL